MPMTLKGLAIKSLDLQSHLEWISRKSMTEPEPISESLNGVHVNTIKSMPSTLLQVIHGLDE
jgi:hypothetical protein